MRNKTNDVIMIVKNEKLRTNETNKYAFRRTPQHHDRKTELQFCSHLRLTKLLNRQSIKNVMRQRKTNDEHV